MIFFIPSFSMCMEMETNSLKPWDEVTSSDKEYLLKHSIEKSDIELFVKAAKRVFDCTILIKNKAITLDNIIMNRSLGPFYPSLTSYKEKATHISEQYNTDGTITDFEREEYVKCVASFGITLLLSLPITLQTQSVEILLANLLIPTAFSTFSIKRYYDRAENSEQIAKIMGYICAVGQSHKSWEQRLVSYSV